MKDLRSLILLIFVIYISTGNIFYVSDLNAQSDPAAGDLIWHTFHGGTRNAEASSIVFDAEGSIFVTSGNMSTRGTPITVTISLY
jgi:hypothetical protein